MTQEEHWKKAYQDLRNAAAAAKDRQAAEHREKYDSLEKEFKAREARTVELSGKIQQKKEQADKLIDELESVLFFIHDDIRSTLALDTVIRIEHTLREIKEYRFGPKSKKQ